MKIKRILSLALSGVLAVSMLAGCGFGGANLPSDQTSAVVGAMNSNADSMLSYKGNDSKLKGAVVKAANTITSETQIVNDVDESLSKTVQTETGYDDLWLESAWKVATEEGSKTYVKVFVYSADNKDYDTATEVANEVTEELKVMNLENATKGNGVTNSYTGNVAAYQKTVGEGDNAITVWVIGVAVTQTVTADE